MLTSCVLKQQSLEFDSGSLFLQAFNAAIISLNARNVPDQALPMELITDRINAYLNRQLLAHKLVQTARLTGKEPAVGVGLNPDEPMPQQLVIALPKLPGGQPAPPNLVRLLLDEINQLPPVRGSARWCQGGGSETVQSARVSRLGAEPISGRIHFP